MNDWAMMIDTIRKHYGTFDSIVPILGMKKTTLKRMKSDLGVEPRHSKGELIIEVYIRIKKSEVCK